MEQSAARPNGVGDLANRLDDAGLVVGRHHRDDCGFAVYRGGNRIRIDSSLAIDTDDLDPMAEPPDESGGLEDGVVLDGCGHHPTRSDQRRPDDGEVVRIGPPSGEHDFERVTGAKGSSDALPSLLDRILGAARHRMDS